MNQATIEPSYYSKIAIERTSRVTNLAKLTLCFSCRLFNKFFMEVSEIPTFFYTYR